MECSKYQDSLREAWLNGDFYEAIVCPYDDQMGALTFGLFIYGAVMMGLYIRTGNAIVPTVITIVAGTVAVSRIPSRAVQIVVIALMLIFTTGGYFLYRKVQTTA